MHALFLRQDYCYSGDPYRGTQSMTKGGIPCQAWASQFPHTHNKLPAAYPDAGLDANYCRNPNEFSGPWCFTNDTSKRWDYCVVDTCPKPPSAPPPRAPPAPPCELLVLTLCAPQNGPQTCTSGWRALCKSHSRYSARPSAAQIIRASAGGMSSMQVWGALGAPETCTASKLRARGAPPSQPWSSALIVVVSTMSSAQLRRLTLNGS